MPLHLLGKKSWNVYNADNVARVRRDEAAAKAAEEGEEQRMQEIDAQRRLAILRGEEPPPIEEPESPKPNETSIGDRDASHRGPRRKRKRPDEDDTDFEMRIARENENKALMKTEPERKSTSSAPIVDHNGHIDLLGDEKSRAHAEKNEEAEKEAKKKKQSYEDQFMMRLSNASGKDGVLRPWYSQADAAAPDASSKDVWGNQDPNRRDRDAKRVASNDPLAMMKQGASKVRELKQDRKRFQEEREQELKNLRREERHLEKKRRRHEVVIERDHRIAMSEDNGLKSEGMIVIDTMIHGVEDMSVMTENGLGMGEGATTRMNHEEKGVDKIKNTTRNKTCDLEKEEIKNDDKVVMNCDSDQHTLLTTFYTVIHEAV
ncbi:unnamed protein product [Fusarium graminearum]|uniref:Chromosome 3, complete genome n=1 Tax=Gibberella zeae (strain ATCC MYA-4620 / CBS 123657 / FGSC 9075 / NRRL 31084 / PH-1) TaxID=229533 RepID=A0A1C3YK89_GIBZE|nr:hypothetical protein HG531_010905 [Fusarium graminearum]PCD36806.1 hypothetical protein FGRA07_07810 [Fusarium graminearum]CAF3587127.1 unnamed protein product [Fusarium graminearum]CAG1980359.1 unnamed protein product [Fusarium graminearum]CAG1981777.1 unnamed protein product [Fusarium graminearum]